MHLCRQYDSPIIHTSLLFCNNINYNMIRKRFNSLWRIHVTRQLKVIAFFYRICVHSPHEKMVRWSDEKIWKVNYRIVISKDSYKHVFMKNMLQDCSDFFLIRNMQAWHYFVYAQLPPTKGSAQVKTRWYYGRSQASANVSIITITNFASCKRFLWFWQFITLLYLNTDGWKI